VAKTKVKQKLKVALTFVFKLICDFVVMNAVSSKTFVLNRVVGQS